MVITDMQLNELIELSSKDANLSENMIRSLFEQAKDWEVVSRKDGYQIQRTFVFDNFYEATRFVHSIGQRTRTANHYPHIAVDNERVQLIWRSPDVAGLHQNDLTMAIETDEVFNAWSPEAGIVDAVDEASAESFPASDPPAHTPDESQKA